MNRTLVKSLLRLIRTTMSRFLAVLAIVSIGVAFFTGVSGSADLMAVSVDEYSDELNLKDITVYSNYGFDEEDVNAVKNTEGVLRAEGSKFTDVIGIYENDTWVTRVHSINEDHQINQFLLVKGRMPQNDHEALAENGSDLEPGFPLGAVVQVSLPDGSRNENLKSDRFTVVGTIDTPLYLNEIKENSTLSNQYIRSYLYINESAFDMDYYTELNVLSEKGKSFNSFTEPYEKYSSEVKENIKDTASSQQYVRADRLKNEALEEYEKGLAEYNDAKKEYEDQIEDAEQELKDGEAEIIDGEAKLADGENELAAGIAELNSQSADAQRALAEALALLKSSEAQLAAKKAEFESRRAELLNTIKTLEDGIELLKQAKDGLARIDEGLVQIDDALEKMNDEKTLLLIGLLRSVDEDMPLDTLKDLSERSAEIIDEIREILPEIDDLKIEDIQKGLSEAEEQIRSDSEYLASEEAVQFIESLKETEPDTPIEEYPEEIPETLLEILQRYDPLTQPDTVGTLLGSCETVMERVSFLCSILDSEEYETISKLIEDLDPEKSLPESITADLSEMNDMIAMLEEQTGRKIETAGDLVQAYDELKAELEDTRTDLLAKRSSVISQLQEQGIEEDGIDDAVREYEDLIRTIHEGIADGERQLADAGRQLAEGYSQYYAGKNQADILLEEGRRKIAEGQREIERNRRKLNDAKALLKEGYEELQKAKSEGQEALDEALAKLNDGKEQIDAMEKGSWTVLDRKSHYASATYHQTVDQMRAIGDVFPLFFILVAALVCLTTMSRMVSEQRSETGTLRALGYTRLQCASKYLIYALLATLTGCVIGSVIGLETFPRIIYNAWRMMYILPPLVLKVPWRLVLFTAFMFVAAMELTTWLVIRSDMKEVPASLMRPKVIQSGRRTLIERIGMIWNRLTFTWKVTVRNIFRYRRRFIMTVLGVAGCCGLMVTGYGIRDSINSMVDLQFFEILQFEGTASLAEDITEEETETLIRKLEAREDIESVQITSGYSAKAHAKQDDELEETLSAHIFAHASDAENAYVLRTRKKHTPIHLNDEGIVINERLAENLSLKKGDTFMMQDEEGKYLEVTVSDICELYIYHYAFMTEDYYRKVSGKSCDNKTLFIHVNGDEEVSRKLQSDLMEEPLISSISFYDETLENFSSMVKSLDLIVWTLIFSSMALAFVVLGNLININVSERQREIATLKVLGFRRKEVQSYIFKENNILTCIGALAGLPLGNYLHHYIMSCIEMDFVMFGRSVKPMSFVISAVFTVVFGMAVNFAMAGNLDRIAMVESLKSVE